MAELGLQEFQIQPVAVEGCQGLQEMEVGVGVHQEEGEGEGASQVLQAREEGVGGRQEPQAEEGVGGRQEPQAEEGAGGRQEPQAEEGVGGGREPQAEEGAVGGQEAPPGEGGVGPRGASHPPGRRAPPPPPPPPGGGSPAPAWVRLEPGTRSLQPRSLPRHQPTSSSRSQDAPPTEQRRTVGQASATG